MILRYEDNMQKSWYIMKKVIGKNKFANNSLPNPLILNNRNILIKKPLPIASMNILLTLDQKVHLNYLNYKDHLRCILKD